MKRVLMGSGALAVLLLLAGPGTAEAQDGLEGIQTPSHNIYCLIEGPITDDGVTDLRCELAEITSKPLPRPVRCEGDWGLGFEVTQNDSVGRRICISDTIKNPSYPVLPYGREWTSSGFTCRSETTGLSCSNSKGHGFMLSRAVQRLF
jgi:hypothetical protein